MFFEYAPFTNYYLGNNIFNNWRGVSVFDYNLFLFAFLHFATLYSVELFIFVLMCWQTSESLHPYFVDI
jgi:hypothetical protein